LSLDPGSLSLGLVESLCNPQFTPDLGTMKIAVIVVLFQLVLLMSLLTDSRVTGLRSRRSATHSNNYDNSWCFRGIHDDDNCPEKSTFHDCVRCCYNLASYYHSPPSRGVCLATCKDQFPRPVLSDQPSDNLLIS